MASTARTDNSEAVRNRKRPPYYHPLGLEILDASEGFARMKMPYSEHLLNVYGSINGGIITTLADAATANALMTVYDGKSLLTIDAKINFIRPALSDLYCEARVRHRGRQMAVCDAEITNAKGKAIAMGLFTYAIRKLRDETGSEALK